jgi:hypothetical protein
MVEVKSSHHAHPRCSCHPDTQSHRWLPEQSPGGKRGREAPGRGGSRAYLLRLIHGPLGGEGRGLRLPQLAWTFSGHLQLLAFLCGCLPLCAIGLGVQGHHYPARHRLSLAAELLAPGPQLASCHPQEADPTSPAIPSLLTGAGSTCVQYSWGLGLWRPAGRGWVASPHLRRFLGGWEGGVSLLPLYFSSPLQVRSSRVVFSGSRVKSSLCPLPQREGRGLCQGLLQL